jgi:hypothetical protein
MEVDRPVDIGASNDDFNLETFVEDDGNGYGTHEMDDISQGWENDELDVVSTDEDDYSSGPSTPDDVLEDEYRSGPSIEDESDPCEVGFMVSFGVLAGRSLRMEYNDLELKRLKVVHVEVPSIPNFMDISIVEQAICDTGLTLLANEILEIEEVEIKKGMLFDTLEHL